MGSTTVRLVILSGVVLAGCHTVQRAAVSTFRVIDAPARYVRERIDEPPATTSTTPEYSTSDVATPGRPVQVPSARVTPTPRTVTGPRTVTPTATPGSVVRSEATAPPRPSPRATPRPAAAPTTQFPTARQVPGKPGFVYSIDPNGGIVDVTGYKSGDKAKDPYTQQIFIVP